MSDTGLQDSHMPHLRTTPNISYFTTMQYVPLRAEYDKCGAVLRSAFFPLHGLSVAVSVPRVLSSIDATS